MSCFRACDIRGVYAAEVHERLFWGLGRARIACASWRIQQVTVHPEVLEGFFNLTEGFQRSG